MSLLRFFMKQTLGSKKFYLLSFKELFLTGITKPPALIVNTLSLSLRLFLSLCFTMRKKLPKTLDLLIFSIYSLNLSLEFLELLKFSHNLSNISKFLPPQRCKTLRSY